ncbi:branched-chain amino acid transport system II carrier protein [Capnocytophaga canimorsus]|nr:branched-chain amino acid transport system II carrier protein [Capnocytophaga canimorsus]WGU70418.1 branched-chain amino acid transport system II carrier protein [Capnocytophaga canimorsus]
MFFSVAFAAFSMIFGAGNLILPPFLGLQAGEDWFLMACGFSLSSVLLAVLGMLVHARLQGTVMDFWGENSYQNWAYLLFDNLCPVCDFTCSKNGFGNL